MKSHSKKMKVQRLDSKDIISTLPQIIIENILTCMPIRDAVRTSILSRKWRFCWTSMPKLEFDDKLVKALSNKKRLKKYKLASAILHVLLLHTGSIQVFSLDVGEVKMCSEFDQITRYLSRNKNLQKFFFKSSQKYHYKLPSSFFSLQGLEVLELTNCNFKPPITFNGFGRLRELAFGNVKITSKTLQLFLSKCPLLTTLSLIARPEDYRAGGNKFTFLKLLLCVPLIESLDIRDVYMKYLSAGGMPHTLPTSLVALKSLYLDVHLTEQDEISATLCLITNSPNLRCFCLKVEKSDTPQISRNIPDFQEHSGITLDHLKVFDMCNFTNLDIEVEFMKFIIAKSPMLEKACIELSETVTVEEELKILRDFIPLPFPLASPSTKFIIERPKLS